MQADKSTQTTVRTYIKGMARCRVYLHSHTTHKPTLWPNTPKKKAARLQWLKSVVGKCGPNRVLNSINGHILVVYTRDTASYVNCFRISELSEQYLMLKSPKDRGIQWSPASEADNVRVITHHFLPGPWLSSKLESVTALFLYQFMLHGEQRCMHVNSLSPLPSNRHHRSSGDCVEGRGGNCQVCSVQYCVQQLCTVRCTDIWTN